MAQKDEHESIVSGCDICREPRDLCELKHLPICVYGSEGINLCDICEVALSEHLRAMRSAANRSHKRGWLAGKMIATAAGR